MRPPHRSLGDGFKGTFLIPQETMALGRSVRAPRFGGAGGRGGAGYFPGRDAERCFASTPALPRGSRGPHFGGGVSFPPPSALRSRTVATRRAGVPGACAEKA